MPPEEHKLNVEISTDKPQYLPGENGSIHSIDATSADGKPVAAREFSLGVVDEAIYAIRPDDARRICWTSSSATNGTRVYTDEFVELLFQRRGGQAPHATGANCVHPSQAGAAQAGTAGAAQGSQGVSRYGVLGRGPDAPIAPDKRAAKVDSPTR